MKASIFDVWLILNALLGVVLVYFVIYLKNVLVKKNNFYLLRGITFEQLSFLKYILQWMPLLAKGRYFSSYILNVTLLIYYFKFSTDDIFLKYLFMSFSWRWNTCYNIFSSARDHGWSLFEWMDVIYQNLIIFDCVRRSHWGIITVASLEYLCSNVSGHKSVSCKPFSVSSHSFTKKAW